MSHQHLNHCMVLHIHQEMMDALDLNNIVKEFAQANERRIAFFRPNKIVMTILKFSYLVLTCYNGFY